MNSLSEFAFSIRLLRKSPGFTALCVLVIALGVGIILVLFNLANNLFFRLPALPESDRYVAILGVHESLGFTNADLLDEYTYQRIADSSESYDVIGKMRFWGDSTLSGEDSAAAYYSTSISPNLMRMVGASPVLGRGLVAADSIPGAEQVVVISYDVWQSYYSGDVNIIGTRSIIDSEPRTIVGVMPNNFSFPAFHKLWLPAIDRQDYQPGVGRVTAVAFLKEGVSQQQAQSELTAILDQIRSERPLIYSKLEAKVLPYISVYESNGSALRDLLLVTCIAILGLACLNVASLLLVRASERNQELIIRAAVGGTRWRIMVQALIEPFLICIGGGAIGLVFAYYGIKITGQAWRLGFDGGSLPFWMVFEIDSSTTLLAGFIILLLWLVIGGYRAWCASGITPELFLNDNSKSAGLKSVGKFASSVVSLQVIISVLLLIIGGTTVVAIRAIETADIGTSVDNYLTARAVLDGDSYDTVNERLHYLETLQEEIASIAGIVQSEFTSALPGGRGTSVASYGLEDRDVKVNFNYPTQFEVAVSHGYFQLMDVPLVEGRYFNSGDTEDSLPVAIIGQSFAESMWSQGSALGKRILIHAGEEDLEQWLTIVGVVPHIIQSQPIAGLREIPSVYRPLSQTGFSYINVVAKTRAPPDLYREAMVAAAGRVDRSIALRDIKSLKQVVATSTFGQSILSNQMAWVSFVVLVLAISGIFGLIARSVLSRKHEIGIRRALGLTQSQTIFLFLRQATIYLILGLCIGGSAGVIGAFGTSSEMPEVLDAVVPVTFGVAMTMIFLIMAASYIPTRLLTKLEPGEALHYE